MKTLIIQTRGDRFGAQIIPWIGQIILGHFNKFYISYININDNTQYGNNKYYKENIFTVSLNKLIDKINLGKKRYSETVSYDIKDWCRFNLMCCITIKQDMISYFRLKLLDDFNKIFDSLLKERYHKFNKIEKNISIHVRLDDILRKYRKDRLRFGNTDLIWEDYDGDITFQLIMKNINNDFLYRCHTDDIVDKSCRLKFKTNNRSLHLIYNGAAMISSENAEKILTKVKEKFQEYDIKCVCSPLGDLHLNYERISNEDFVEDFIYLIFSDVVILTKSTFAIASAFFHRGSNIYVNKWGHSASVGLGSKYDKSNIELF